MVQIDFTDGRENNQGDREIKLESAQFKLLVLGQDFESLASAHIFLPYLNIPQFGEKFLDSN